MKPIKQHYLILSAQSYRIVDENTGAVNEGISLWYITMGHVRYPV